MPTELQVEEGHAGVAEEQPGFPVEPRSQPVCVRLGKGGWLAGASARQLEDIGVLFSG